MFSVHASCLFCWLTRVCYSKAPWLSSNNVVALPCDIPISSIIDLIYIIVSAASQATKKSASVELRPTAAWNLGL